MTWLPMQEILRKPRPWKQRSVSCFGSTAFGCVELGGLRKLFPQMRASIYPPSMSVDCSLFLRGCCS